MQTRVMASLNGVSMHALDPLIIIQKITEAAPSWNVNAGSRGSLTGQRYINTEKRYREVQIAFAVREIRDLARREQALQAVAGWAAAGGVLTLNYRAGQQLRVVCSGLQAVAGINNWAENYTVTLRAYDQPMWEKTTQDTASTASGQTGTATLNVSGNAETKLGLTVTNSSGGTINAASVSANGMTMTFANLGLAAGETLEIDHDERDLLRIRIKNANNVYRSALDKRTAESDDEILLRPGNNTVTTTSGRSMIFRLFTYGRYEG